MYKRLVFAKNTLIRRTLTEVKSCSQIVSSLKTLCTSQNTQPLEFLSCARALLNILYRDRQLHDFISCINYIIISIHCKLLILKRKNILCALFMLILQSFIIVITECYLLCFLRSFAVFFGSFVDLNLIMEIYVNYASIIYQRQQHTHSSSNKEHKRKALNILSRNVWTIGHGCTFRYIQNQTLPGLSMNFRCHMKQPAKCVFCFYSNWKQQFHSFALHFCMNERLDVNEAVFKAFVNREERERKPEWERA